MWLYGTLTDDGSGLNVWIPPRQQGRLRGGLDRERTGAGAIGDVLLSPTSMAIWGNFPASGNVIVKVSHGGSGDHLLLQQCNGLVVTIPGPINVLLPFTIEVTSPDGTKVSNVYSFTPLLDRF